MASERDAYNELCGYTIAHALGHAAFIHQHVVDAFAAQQAGAETKPIAITFALVGLYLHIERGFSGRQVQHVHKRLAREKHDWPVFVLPAMRGSTTALDVIAEPQGPARDAAIDRWCASVWSAYVENRQTVIDLLKTHGVV